MVGIDVGTSSAKAVVLAANGQVRAVAAQEYPVDTPRAGWASQRPDTWVRAVEATVGRAIWMAGSAPSQVVGLALSGQMHGMVCLDATGQPLRPAIIWADQRSRLQVDDLKATLGKAKLAAWTGNPLATGFMLPSWLWVRKEEPQIADRTRWLLLPKDYVRYRMTGEIGTEPSDASSTSLFDPRQRRWSLPLLETLGVRPDLLPPVRPSAAVAGLLLPASAEAMGLRPGIPVVFGGSDQATQALGNGIVSEGTLSSTIGTGGQLLVPTARPVVDEELRLHCFCHVIDALWHAETAMLSAGLSLRWLRDQAIVETDYGAMADLAASAPVGADGLFFLPYLAGERTPHMDPRARGGFVGLTRRHGRPHLIRAVMEGVVLGMRQGLELLRSLGVSVREVVASGGGTRHPLWLQLQADIYNCAVRRASTREAASVGAALLAGIGTGVYENASEAVERAVHWEATVTEPTEARARQYDEAYQIYCDLYPALRTTMHRLSYVAEGT